MVLKEIASIQTGVFTKPIPNGEIVYLQAKHFDGNGLLKTSLHADLKMNSSIEKHLLKPGDVLFSAKGTKNFAAVYEDHNQPCVASTSFFVIRLAEHTILPNYLVWYLNNPSVQQVLKAQAIGSSMVSISKGVLEELEISIPDLEIQTTILKITQLRNSEISIKQQIEALREKLILQQISNAIK